jgi:hypothetical protein
LFDNNVADTDNYLIYNYNAFAYSMIEGLWFEAKNSVEKFYYGYCTGGSGRVQNIRFANCKWVNFMEGVTVDGSTDTSENVWTNCKIQGVPSGGTFLQVINNAQSVDYNFYGCDMELISGIAFKFLAGGNLNVFGGSMITNNNGQLFYANDPSGSKIGTGNDSFNFFGTRTEIRDTSTLFYFQCVGKLTFDNCQLTVLTVGKETVNKGTLDTHGTVVFRGCRNFYYYTILTMDSDYAYIDTPLMIFTDCLLNAQIGTLVTTTHTGSNKGGMGKAIVERCRSYAHGEPVNTTLNKTWGYINNTIPKHTYIYRAGPVFTQGLPNNTTTTFKLPIGAIIRKVIIVHNASTSGAYDYTIQSSDATPVVFAQMLSQNGTVANTVMSADLWYEVVDEAHRTINVVAGGATPTNPQSGYIVVEYI